MSLQNETNEEKIGDKAEVIPSDDGGSKGKRARDDDDEIYEQFLKDSEKIIEDFEEIQKERRQHLLDLEERVHQMERLGQRLMNQTSLILEMERQRRLRRARRRWYD